MYFIITVSNGGGRVRESYYIKTILASNNKQAMIESVLTSL